VTVDIFKIKKWTEMKEAGINMRIISLLVLKIKNSMLLKALRQSIISNKKRWVRGYRSAVQ